MNIRGLLIESLADDLIHKLHHGRLFIVFVDDVGLIATVQLSGIDLAPLEDLVKGIGTDSVKISQCEEHAFARCQAPAHRGIYLTRHGLSRDQVKGI